jgi:hypothetical protein
MLYSAHDDLIAFMDESFSKGESECVQAVGRTFGEDNLIGTVRSDESSYRFARFLMLHRSHLAQMMHAAMDITVPVAVCFHDRLYHSLWLLARSSVVEVH